MGLESQRSSPLGPKGGSDLQEEAPDGLKQDYGSKTRPSPQSLGGGLALALASPKPQSGHSIPHSIPTSPDPRYRAGLRGQCNAGLDQGDEGRPGAGTRRCLNREAGERDLFPQARFDVTSARIQECLHEWKQYVGSITLKDRLTLPRTCATTEPLLPGTPHPFAEQFAKKCLDINHCLGQPELGTTPSARPVLLGDPPRAASRLAPLSLLLLPTRVERD